MTSDHVVVKPEDCARNVAKEQQPRGDTVHTGCAVAAELLARHGPESRHIAQRRSWIKWAGKQRIQQFPGSVFAHIRNLVLKAVRPRSAGPPLRNASRATLLAPGRNHGGA
jgi:hypothetical protein